MANASSAKMYGNAMKNAFAKQIDWLNGNIKVMMVSGSYNPDQDAHAYLDAVRPSEMVASGYTAGGFLLTGKTANYDSANNKVVFDANDLLNVLTGFSGSCRYLVIYDDTPATDATKPLIAYLDYGSVQTANNGNVSITWDTNGIFYATTP